MFTIILTILATIIVLLVIFNATPGERKIQHRIRADYSVHEPQFFRTMGNLLGPSLLPGNRITTLINGDQIFPAMLKAISEAKSTITLLTYIYWSGDIGKQIAEALIERAKAGVKVHVLVDWFGSIKMDDHYLESMREEGIVIEKYRPPQLYTLAKLNIRTHRRILIVDGKIGFTGGVGIADQWLGDADSPDHWRDSQYQLEGPAVAQMQATFMDNWLVTKAEVLQGEGYFPPLEPVGNSYAQVYRSNPGEGSESVRLMYLLSFACARKSIRIGHAYFIPDRLSMELLVSARKKGVKIEIILPGAKTDVPLVRSASRSRWKALLKAGIKIYEYQPTMYHCKIIIVDDYWVSVGSTNFDNRSFHFNDEVNLNVMDAAFAEEQVKYFEEDKKLARRIYLEDWQRRPVSEKAWEFVAGLVQSQL